MGEVFQAERLDTGRAVAIKILRPELSEDEHVTRRFFQEARAANRMRHPNIVDILDAGFSTRGPYIVMELLIGESSATTLARVGKLPVEGVVAIGLSVLRALQVAHNEEIIHRDLKPENVFLHRPSPAASTIVKLLDFGIAKVLQPLGPTPRTQTGVIFGTPDYLSPEQALGDFALDGRSDLFAVGVLLFELLTGTRPFRAPTAIATAYKVVHAEAPKLVDAGGPDHPMLEAVLSRALQKRPENRYPSASHFARELEGIAPDPKLRHVALEGLFHGANAPSRGAQSKGAPSTPPTVNWLAGPSSDVEPYSPFDDPRWKTQPSSFAPRKVPTQRVRPPSSSQPETLPEPSSLWPGATKSSRFLDPPSSSVGYPSLSERRGSPARGEGIFGVSDGGPSSRRLSERPTMPEAAPSRPGAQLRGTILRALDRSVVRRHGILLRAGVLERLPPEYAEEFRFSTIAGAILYGMDALETYAAALVELVPEANSTYFRELGRAGAEQELTILLRPLFRAADDISLLRRGATLWSRLLDFGSWTVTSDTEGKILIRIREFSPAPTALRHWVVGMIEQTLWSAGFDRAELAILAGDYPPAKELVIEVRSGRRQ